MQNWSEIRAIEYLLIHKNLCTKRAKSCRTQVSTSIPVKLLCSPNKSLETPKICIGGKGKETFQYVKPPAERETQPHLGHVPEPGRTSENNVENIQEEIKSYLSSALQLFGQLPSGPITTGHPGTQSYQAKSTPTKQCLAFTPAIRPKEICPSLHAVAKIPKSWRNRSFC